MEKAQWKEIIKAACEQAGTYEEYYDSIIDTLAGIMDARDRAQVQFEHFHSAPVLKHTNKAGHVNYVKNPMLSAVLDCNAQALAYWRDLGLTPAGFKKLNGAVESAGDSLGSLLGNLEF